LKLKEKKKVSFKSKAALSVKIKPVKSKFLELEADEGSASDCAEDHEREITRPAKGKTNKFIYLFLESESYTADQLKPKAARLTKNFIDDIANRYVNQADDENEDSPIESEGDSD
jgi:hypothetical protein